MIGGMTGMTASQRTIMTLSSLGAALLIVGGATLWLLNGGAGGGPRRAAASESQRLEALRAGLEAAAKYVASEQDEQAAIILEKLVEEYPLDPLVLAQLAELRLHQGRDSEAYDLYRTLIVNHKADRTTHFNAGLVAARLDRVEEAIAHLEEACRLDPADVQAPLYLANLYRKTHENTQAQEQLLRVIKLDESQHLAWGGLAQIAFVENKLDLAEQHVARARGLEPQFATWQILQAKILRRRGRPEAAITMLAALGEGRYQQEVVDEIAQCWALLGSPRKAAQEHVDFLNRRADALPSAIAASRFFLMAGERSEAESWMRYALRLDPDSPEAQALEKQFAQAPEDGQ